MSVDTNPFDLALRSTLRKWGITISPERMRRLRTHFDLMVEANRSVNLTRITDPIEAAVKHYADSLALLLWVARRSVEVTSVLDVGTGAGFPAVPLAVMRPDWSITAIDATRKKIDFLRRAAAAIGLENLHTEHAHSQHWEQSSAGSEPTTSSRSSSARGFDLVVFRALAKLAKSLEQTAGYVASGGRIVAYRSAADDPSDEAAAASVAEALQLELEERFPYQLDLNPYAQSRGACNGEQPTLPKAHSQAHSEYRNTHSDGHVINRVLCVYRKK